MFNSNLFPVKNGKNRIITIFNIKVCPPPGPCILLWCIDTTYVSGKLALGGGGAYLKIENGDDPIFKYLVGNKFTLIDISVICTCNKIKLKAS